MKKKKGSWHTRSEKKLIKKFGGTPLRKYGTDGTIRGKPVEVRCQRKDKRFRLQKNVHKALVRGRGSYIFDSPGHKPKRLSAKEVSKKLGRKPWLKDRAYPHKFLRRRDIW